MKPHHSTNLAPKHQVVQNGDRTENKIALTFDDGPNPHATHEILDILERFGARATFFVVGRRCQEYPDLLHEIQARGHQIGNHTFSHVSGDFQACAEIIERTIGVVPAFVRPPYFDMSLCDAEQAYLREKTIMLCDLNPGDWRSEVTSEAICTQVLSESRNGTIIDFHDGSEIDADLPGRARKTIDALPIILASFAGKFDCARLDEMKLEYSEHS